MTGGSGHDVSSITPEVTGFPPETTVVPNANCVTAAMIVTMSQQKRLLYQHVTCAHNVGACR